MSRDLSGRNDPAATQATPPGWMVNPSDLDGITPEELDKLPYGVIQLNLLGEVIAFNAAEERASGFSRNRVVGRNFFTEIAPCTNVQDFLGPFRQAALTRQLKRPV